LTIKYITFDCYDTLVAYSASKSASVRAMVREKGGDDDAAEKAIHIFSQTERHYQTSAQFRPLAAVLHDSLEAALSGLGIEYDEADGERIVEAVRDARPFDDVAPVLARLRDHFKTAILSNSQNDIITHNIEKIGIPFDQVVVAEEVGCYKPDQRMFQALLAHCQCEVDEIVHIAQGFYHDIIPGHELGLRRVWINRNGLDGDDTYGPYDELPDLNGLPELLGI
jgi:2-haloacid dehalogenase